MKKWLVIVFSLITYVSFGQAVSPQSIGLPNILPASPNAASIAKFGNIPVTPSNGTTSVGIPIWDISCGGLSWPLSFSYNTGGIKVDEISSNVGLGWALTGQGVITRTVVGRSDDEASNAPNYDSVTYDHLSFLYGAVAGQIDSEVDAYSYNFNGKSGKFYIQQNGAVFAAPYTKMKITRNSSGFIVIDENGYIYTFYKTETTNPVGETPYISSWYLTKVESPEKKQSIVFTYDNTNTISQTTNSFTQSVGRRCGPTCAVNQIYNPIPDHFSQIIHTNVCRLTKIEFPNGYIDFNYLNDRLDISGGAYHRLTNVEIKSAGTNQLVKKFSLTQAYFTPGNRLKLTAISETKNANGPKKEYSFTYSNTPMVPVGSYAQDKWGFNNGKTENLSLMGRDTVLFINVDGTSTTFNIGNADRRVDTVAAKAGTLTGITWPTGGKTEFTYDMHQFPGGNENYTTQKFVQAIGTIRTATDTFTYPVSNAWNARVVVDISRYNFPGATTGEPYVQIKDLTTGVIVYTWSNPTAAMPRYVEQAITLVQGHQYEIKGEIFATGSGEGFFSKLRVLWTVTAAPTALEKGGGLRIRTVKNYTKDGVLANTDYYEYEKGVTLSQYYVVNLNKKTTRFSDCCTSGPEPTSCISALVDVYHSQAIYPRTTVGGVPVMYQKVKKYQLDASGITKGKTEYEYNVLRDQIEQEKQGLSWVQFTANDWKNGTLLKETHFKWDGTEYQPVKKTEYEYSEIKINSINNLHVIPLLSGDCYPMHEDYVRSKLEFFYLPKWTGINKLIKTTETEYDDNGNTHLSYIYNEYTDSTHDFLTKQKTVDSKGRTKITTFKYPSDFASTGNVYQKMLNANILTPIIETKLSTDNGTTLLTTVKNNYRDWKNDGLVLAPEFIQSSIYSNSLSNKVVFTNYNDRKKPTEVKKDQNTPLYYLYGYNVQYPVAEVSNAVQSEIAYTSFEAGDKGDWLFTGTPIKDITTPTGEMCYQFSNTISRSITITGQSYIVSYWKKSGTVSIAGTTANAGRTVNGWTYYEHIVNSPAPSTISLSGTNAIIDELRLYPAKSLMKTYAYDPLIGVTSECDANNRIIYYEYDELQRLALIRDQDKKIVKKFAYNYSGQTAYDNIYYNVATSTAFRRNNCTGCLVGSLVTYTVPANTYSSTHSQAEANSLATADVAANGQAYANANGTCGSAPTASVLSTVSISKILTYTFHNNCTGTDIVYSRQSNEVDWPLPNIPEGNYDITLNIPTGGYYAFKIFTTAQNFTTTTSTLPVTVSNVTFGPTGNKLTVTP